MTENLFYKWREAMANEEGRVITQEEAANILGIHRKTWAGWETGKTEAPHIALLALQASYMGLPPWPRGSGLEKKIRAVRESMAALRANVDKL